ncbi:MAG: type I pullulanase [bacterium]|nr:type I pullulanase [bacterium]
MKTAQEWKEWYSMPEFREKNTYQGNDLGVCCAEDKTTFLLWSPCATNVTLHLYREGEGGSAYQKLPMQREDGGVWAYRTEEEMHGVYYEYELLIDGETVYSADPYAKACGVNGKRSMAVNLKRTNPKGWEQDKSPAYAQENVIYELHVKEFSWDERGGFPEEYRGKYKAFLCENTTLDRDGVHKTGCGYLRELGVTHIQLMPTYDYGSVDEAGDETEFNWGYDPVNYNVPEGSYATDARKGEVRIREMKEMVQSLHRQGLRVIMDVVYNHTYSLDSWLQRTAPWYYYRTWEDGRVSDGSACGNDVASERPMCAKYILDSVLYWAEEYHIDGFRFDLMGLLDVELMNRIQRELDMRYGRGEKLLYGEPWAAVGSAVEHGTKTALKENVHLLDARIGIFCDNTRNAVKGSVFDVDKVGFVNGAKGLEKAILDSVQAWCGPDGFGAKAPSQILTYVSAHDNQTLWDKIVDTVPDERIWMRVNRMAAAVYMTCQGNLFLLSGEEFARTKGGMDNSYNAPIAINRLDWGRTWENRTLVEYYRGLIALRKKLPGLCDKSEDAWKRVHGTWVKEQAVGFLLDNTQHCEDRKKHADTAWEELCVVYNARPEELVVQVPEGDWQVLVDAQNSFWWDTSLEHSKKVVMVSGKVHVEAVSVLVLGRRRGSAEQ